MGDSGLLAAIAQWLATVGVPAMVWAWYRQREDTAALKTEVALLKAKFSDYATMRSDMNIMATTVTEIRIIVGQLKEEADRNRRLTERRT